MQSNLQEKQCCGYYRVVLNDTEKAITYHLTPLYVPSWKQSLISRVHQLSYYGKPTCFEGSVCYCFCAGPGMWNISGPRQNPGISYIVSSVDVGTMNFPLQDPDQRSSWSDADNHNGILRSGFSFEMQVACWVSSLHSVAASVTLVTLMAF